VGGKRVKGTTLWRGRHSALIVCHCTAGANLFAFAIERKNFFATFVAVMRFRLYGFAQNQLWSTAAATNVAAHATTP
jgi:hypothetical protein